MAEDAKRRLWSEKIRMGTAQKHNPHKPLNSIFGASCNDCYQVSRFFPAIMGDWESKVLELGGSGKIRLRVKTNVCGPTWVAGRRGDKSSRPPWAPRPARNPPPPPPHHPPQDRRGCPGLKNVRKSSWVIWPPL